MKYAISADLMSIKYATTAHFMRIIEKQLHQDYIIAAMYKGKVIFFSTTPVFCAVSL